MWREPLVASRLEARAVIGHVPLIDLAAPVLTRALAPSPVSLPTLDALHIASLEYLRERGLAFELASYDDRMLAAADALRIPVFAL